MIWSKASELEKSGTSFILVTMTTVRGSAPQIPGAKCIVSSNGLEEGTIGGGKVEAQAIKYAQEILLADKRSDPITVTWNLQKDIGMTCGGECSFLFEHFPSSQWKIAIFGAGHVSQSLTRALSKLDCHITVIDDREEWLNKLVDIQFIKTNDAQKAVSKFDENTYFISMTKGHAFDVPFLLEIYRQFPNCPYVGAIGSKSKSNAIKKDLREFNVSEDFLDKLHIPLGLPIGNNTPEEISISIIAELLQIRDQISLRDC